MRFIERKTHVMNKIHCSQEVIVNFKTSFVRRRNQNLTAFNKGNTQSPSFKEECWNNRLPDILPELFRDFTETSNLNTWQIRNKPHFLMLEMSDNPPMMEFEKSIDPNIFLALSSLN